MWVNKRRAELQAKAQSKGDCGIVLQLYGNIKAVKVLPWTYKSGVGD